MNGGPTFHGCIHAGCEAFGSWGRKRRGADGKPVTDWWCRAHLPADYWTVAALAAPPAPTKSKGQGRLAL
ncbi:MAG: hypothetical protein EPN20_12410 [Magnetospirillum sp.]|nr:MAG: hypothetical protein EPN20_12410 [Magnetospirillum sp.]